MEVVAPPASLAGPGTIDPNTATDTKLATLVRSSAKRTREVFASDFGGPSGLAVPELQGYTFTQPREQSVIDASDSANLSTRLRFEYQDTQELPPVLAAKQANAAASAAARRKINRAQAGGTDTTIDARIDRLIEAAPSSASTTSTALTLRRDLNNGLPPNANGPTPQRNTPATALVRRDAVRQERPQWHPPWKLMRVISGHLGWVRALAVEPDNKWFASGAGDRTIKIWDLASGTLRLTLTGHISQVRGLAVSPRHPYLFSCGEDKMVKCWDLETNKVIRHYHGHLSGVYTLSVHPTLDILATGGRDGVIRIWDMRTRSNIHVLSGHKGTVSSAVCQEADPQIISASLDGTIRLWDLAAGKSAGVLTHHKKGVRALAVHPNEFTFASASTGAIKQWKCPEGALMQNFDMQERGAIVNALAVNEDDVMFSGGDDGSLGFWDWKTGHRFQTGESVPQPGSLDAEKGVFTATFDKTGLRLITGEADKTIKIWKMDEEATEETHPLEWQPTLGRRKY